MERTQSSKSQGTALLRKAIMPSWLNELERDAVGMTLKVLLFLDELWSLNEYVYIPL